ncbi:MAG: hypothetical protein KAI79_17520 [Bacteroidales bacterium]|nr:hypothetical protein [Bacteroidales bacterium]
MILYFGLLILALIVIVYFYYQVKIKNNQNYPVVFAMGLAFLVIVGNKSIDWIVKNINEYLQLSLEIPKQLSIYEIGAFFLLLYGLSALYYKSKFGKLTQKNIVLSIFQIGNNDQRNKR